MSVIRALAVMATLAGAALFPARTAALASGGPSGPLGKIWSPSIDMVSPTAGWGGIDWGVIRTTDGGHTWRLVNPRGLTAARYQNCNIAGGESQFEMMGASSLFALDADHAWLTASCPTDGMQPGAARVWRTANGGRTWRVTIVAGASSSQLQFVDRTTGWLLGSSDLETHDAGAHWLTVDANADVHGPLVLGFASPSIGYGAGILSQDQWFQYTCCAELSDFSLFPQVTADGGRTWTVVHAPVPPGFRSALIQIGGVDRFTAGAPGWTGRRFAAIPVELIRPSDGARLCTTYHTDNGGANWWYTAHNTTVCPQSYFNARDGWGFTCIPADCAAQSDTGVPAKVRSYHTTDGGEHWTYLGPKGNWDYHYVRPRIGFSSQLWYGGTIQRTTDAGRTFRLIWPRLVKG